MEPKGLHLDWILTLWLVMALCAQPIRTDAQNAATPLLQPAASLRSAAEQAVRSQLARGSVNPGTLHVSVAALDERLRLPRCAQPLQALVPMGAKSALRMNIGVRCTTPLWTVYVPITVEVDVPVMILQRALPRDSHVIDADVRLETRRVPGLASASIAELAQLSGRHLRQATAAGVALTIDMFAADILIKRGQRVTLIATAGGLEVRALGEALMDATPDGRIRVLNLVSRRPVEGQVESADRVRVAL